MQAYLVPHPWKPLQIAFHFGENFTDPTGSDPAPRNMQAPDLPLKFRVSFAPGTPVPAGPAGACERSLPSGALFARGDGSAGVAGGGRSDRVGEGSAGRGGVDESGAR